MAIFDKLSKLNEAERQRAFGKLLAQATRERKWPYTAYFELTPLCTLDCKMCYVHLRKDQVSKYGRILSGKEWIELARQSIDIGVSEIVFTGGECTLHPDFLEIYREVYSMGGRILVMTNGTLINSEMITFFTKYPPERISITMYGYSGETYEKVCGKYDAFASVKKAIQMIKESGINIVIKCTATSDMVSDIPQIYQFAQENDIEFKYDFTLKANRDCTQENVLETETKPEQRDEVNIKLAELNGQHYTEPPFVIVDYEKPIKENGMLCAAGRSSFHINWRGEMQPCITFDAFISDTLKLGVEESWHLLTEWADNVKQITECQRCKYYLRCKHCVALHWGDTHEFGKPSPRLCYKVQHGITD